MKKETKTQKEEREQGYFLDEKGILYPTENERRI